LQFNEAEQASLATFVSFSGIGISLMNSMSEEVAYMSLVHAAPIWEVEIKSRWRPLSVELTVWLEEQWRADQGHVELEDLLEADLHQMVMNKPFMGALRRVYNPALWLQYRQSTHYTYMHFKVHRLQV
jgi:vacuolar protein sorting-associated protein 13A/C